MNYDIQLAALKEFESYLNIFKEEIGDKLIAYSNRFGALRESVSPHIAETYVTEYCEPNTRVLRDLMDNIGERALPYIRNQIGITEEAIARARMG
jgi:hypothetical protein